MKLLILNGPNINFIGIREPGIYGSTNYESLKKDLIDYCEKNKIEVEVFQSNHEGVLIDKIQEAYYKNVNGIIFNPGGYTHTSIAIMDALKAVSIPTVEVHISDVSKRESFRQISYVGMVAVKTIAGKGVQGYFDAVDYFIQENK